MPSTSQVPIGLLAVCNECRGRRSRDLEERSRWRHRCAQSRQHRLVHPFERAANRLETLSPNYDPLLSNLDPDDDVGVLFSYFCFFFFFDRRANGLSDIEVADRRFALGPALTRTDRSKRWTKARTRVRLALKNSVRKPSMVVGALHRPHGRIVVTPISTTHRLTGQSREQTPCQRERAYRSAWHNNLHDASMTTRRRRR